jgi:hypothetical protein
MGLILRLTLRYSRVGFRHLHSECWRVRSAKNGSNQGILSNIDKQLSPKIVAGRDVIEELVFG